MPRPIFGTCTLRVLQQQRRGRAVATGQHSCTTLSRRVRIRDRTQHTWTALHTRSKRSARRQKVRRHALIRPPSQSLIPLLFHGTHSLLGLPACPTRHSSCCVAWPDCRLGSSSCPHAGCVLPAARQADVAQRRGRHSGTAIVSPALLSLNIPSLDHTELCRHGSELCTIEAH